MANFYDLQASDAQNIGMQVTMKKCQQQLLSGSESAVYKETNRLSLPVEGARLSYKPLKGISLNTFTYLVKQFSNSI